MNKILLGLMLLASMAYSQDSVSSKSYLSLRNLSPNELSSNNLLFFCRQINDDEVTADQLKWQAGILLSTTDDTIRVTARYAPHLDLVELLVNKKTHRLYKEKTQAILIHSTVFVVAPVSVKGDVHYSYFELLSGGNIKLLQKENTFYIQRPSGPLQKVSGNKRQFAGIFTPYQKEIHDFLKENRLHLKKKNDLVQILQFVNSNFDFKAQID